jgi:hypothetical protein
MEDGDSTATSVNKKNNSQDLGRKETSVNKKNDSKETVETEPSVDIEDVSKDSNRLAPSVAIEDHTEDVGTAPSEKMTKTWKKVMEEKHQSKSKAPCL